MRKKLHYQKQTQKKKETTNKRGKVAKIQKNDAFLQEPKIDSITYQKKKKMPVWLRLILIIIGISLFSDLLAAVIRWIQEMVYLFL